MSEGTGTMLKLIFRTGIYLAVLASSMLTAVIPAVLLAWIFMIAARGAGHHLDLTMLFVLGFTTLSIKIFSAVVSVSMDGYRYGFLRSVLVPAFAWYLLAMVLGKQHVFEGWHMYNAISSVVIVSFLYACSVFVLHRRKKLNTDPPGATA